MHNSTTRWLGALGLLALTASAVGAQQAQQAQQAGAGPKWNAWIGCWTGAVDAEAQAATGAPATAPMYVCITPSTGGADVVDVTTIAEGKVVSTQRLDATGSTNPLQEKGCTGTQRATWSADERRIYLKADSNCDGLRSATSAILSMTADGEWLDVRGVASYGSSNVRVARYRDAGIPSALPTELANTLRARGVMSANNARIVAGAPIGAAAVMEASRAADSAVVSAWLLERDQRFTLDAPTLVRLADAGVPASVTDAMVAVSNPTAFNFRRAAPAGRSDVIMTDATRLPPRTTAVMYDPWGWGYSGYGYGGYGYSRYGYGYPISRYGVGSGGYYGNGYYGGYAPPIIIVNGTSQPAQPRGQMVKGQGYRQDPPSSSPSSQRAPSSGSSSSSPSSSSTPSSSAPASAPARTAQPRT